MFWVILLAIPLLATGQSQQSLVGFQDIPWGSSIQVVKNKFPNIRPYDTCKSPEAGDEKSVKEALNSFDKNCVSYALEKYTVGDTDYNLIFNFSVSSKLKAVHIEKYVEGVPSDSAPKCKSSFAKLADLLVHKYGDGATPRPEDDFHGFKSFGFKNHQARLWVLGPTKIYLANSWDHSKANDLCLVSIFYTPTSQGAASKL